MSVLKGAAVFGQSGGPTSVINASAFGCIEACLHNENITKVYAMEYGITGVLNDRLIDINKEDETELRLLLNTPASAFGSCRYKLKDSSEDDTDYRRILEIFRKYDIRYFFYNGGNDSMDTCNKVSKYMLQQGYECRIIGIPKTIDNDLAGTDHCPGFGSAAKYIATSVAEVSCDAHVYTTGTVIIIEIMGRNAGWLAASAALAQITGYGPDLVYVPEVTFDMERFLADVTDIYNRKKVCIVAVSEGVRDAQGRYISEYGSDLASTKDVFGHSQMGGLGETLARFVKDRTGAKTRSIELSLLQRCAAHSASKTDIEEAAMAGRAAVEAAVNGATDKMVGFTCDRAAANQSLTPDRAAETSERFTPDSAGYICRPQLFDLSTVANAEKTIPRAWINASGNGMEEAFLAYALPLIQGTPVIPTEQGLPRYAQLKKKIAK